MIRSIPLGYVSLSLLIVSSMNTAYAAGNSSNENNQIVLIIAAISTALAAIINALSSRQKAGKELLDSVRATQASAFDLLQKQVNTLQKDRDFYRDEVEKLRQEIQELRRNL